MKNPTQHAYIATLPCDTLMSAKQAINDKLQGNVAKYLRCGCGKVVNNQIRKGLLLSLWLKIFLNRNYLANYKQERDCFVYFLRPLAVCWPSAHMPCFWPTLYTDAHHTANIVQCCDPSFPSVRLSLCLSRVSSNLVLSTEQRRGLSVSLSVCLSVCLFHAHSRSCGFKNVLTDVRFPWSTVPPWYSIEFQMGNSMLTMVFLWTIVVFTWCDSAGPILSVFPALIVHSELKSVHPGFPVAFIFLSTS